MTSQPSRSSSDDVNHVIASRHSSGSSARRVNAGSGTATDAAAGAANPPTWKRPLGAPPLRKRITMGPPDYRVLAYPVTAQLDQQGLMIGRIALRIRAHISHA